MLSTMHMYPVDGAASRVGNGETPWAYRDAKWARGHRRRRSESREEGRADRLGAQLLGGHPPLFGGRRLRELHDGRRRGSREGDVSRQLRAPGAREGEVRQGQSVPREPEHQACGHTRSDARVLPKPPFLADLSLDQELAAFERLKPRLADVWTRAVDQRRRRPARRWSCPSLTLDTEELTKLAGASYYEERLLFLLIRLRNPRAHVIYVTASRCIR